MNWRTKVEQLAALLEKIPQPQSFELSKGVYQPYFILELRPSNWEILPYADYTRLDGQPGKEIKLTLQTLDSQKVSITQEELNVLAYIYSVSNLGTRRLFNYGQPVGFLLDWLRESRLKIRNSEDKEVKEVTVVEETGQLSLGLYQQNEHYVLQPAIVFQDESVLLNDQVHILSSNPIYIYYRSKIYRTLSNLPPFFWLNFFRLQQKIEIPLEELKEFINSFVPKILPALDWKSLEDHLKFYELPLTSTRVYLSERAGHLNVDVKFVYESAEFPAHPPVEKSLATRGHYLYVVKRDQEKEKEIRRLLQENGLFYLQYRWQLDPQYKVLDWLRLKVPELAKKGIEIFGEERLHRYRLHRGKPQIHVKVRTGIDWLDLDFQVELEGSPITIPDFKEQLLKNKQYIKLADGSNIYLEEEVLERFKRFFALSDNVRFKGSQKYRLAALPLVEEIIQLADVKELDEGYREWAEKYRRLQKIEQVNIPGSFRGALRDYQQTGVDWLYFLNGVHLGGILADDMGLGKTVQVIALLEKLRAEGELNHPALIVVPVTVIFNWENEIKRFAPKLKTLKYRGQRQEREQLLKKIPQHDVVLMSYGILLQDLEDLQKLEWKYLILDESQKIKNPATKTYRAVTSLVAEHRLCLTGTPVENSVIDLWSQMNFLNPGMLGTLRQFESRFLDKNGNQEESQQLLRRIVKPFILRRTKEEVVKELPARTEILQLVEMTHRQREMYQEGLERYRAQIFHEIEAKGLAKSRLKILEALTYLRQVACHPAIMDETIDLTESGKIQLLEEMLESIIQEGHKVLVFSQFVRFLKLVRRLLEQKGWLYEYLDGSVRKREERIQNFQQNREIKIFLISLKAGGLGLNLTAADYVVHLDPWWNPAVEQQATDRVHRIGQENRVFVYKYIMKNSVEEKIIQLQQKKKELFQNLVTSDGGFVKQLSAKDLELIFNPLT